MKESIRLPSLLVLGFLSACQGNKHSFTLPTEEQSFQQNTLESNQRKIDILWVIDNSGSMASFQQNLAANCQDFIQDFVQKDYDFQMAVVTTDAYLAEPQFKNNPALSRFKDGNLMTGPLGFPIITSQTPIPIMTFTGYVLQGATGSGD